jgi:hypothetical protein
LLTDTILIKRAPKTRKKKRGKNKERSKTIENNFNQKRKKTNQKKIGGKN